MHCRRWLAFQPRRHTTILRLTAMALLVAVAGALLLPTQAAAAGPRYFPETGHNSPDIFATYWAAHGGIALFGLPITEPYLDNCLTIQWFERARFERHPENKDTPFEVELGQLGREVRPADPPVAPTNTANSRYFMDTGHNVALFLPYWSANGDMMSFGQPLTEEIREKNVADNTVYTVQYFERARLESHPENAAPWDIILGQLGRDNAQKVTLQPAMNPITQDKTPAEAKYFPETQHSVGNAFLDYYNAHGALDQFGKP
jgi:hypothetical protein